MGEVVRFPDETGDRSEGRWKARLAASEKIESIVSLANTVGACYEGLLSSCSRLEELARALDGLVIRLPAGEPRQKAEREKALINEQLLGVRRWLADI